MDKKPRQRVIKLATNPPWRRVKSEAYRDSPHEWLKRDPEDPAHWDSLAERIRVRGRTMQWRGQRYKYWVTGRMAYWKIGYIINRTYREALDNGGYPSKAAQRKIFKRFWVGSK